MSLIRSIGPFALVGLAMTCGPSPDAKLPVFPGMHGGSTAGAGGSDTGGTTTVGSGGSTARGSGGLTGSGGRVTGTGGSAGAGGASEGTGGRTTGTGGRSTDAGADARRDSARGTGGGGGTTELPDAGNPGTGGRQDAGRDVFVGRDVGGGTGGIFGGTGGRIGGTGGIFGGTGGGVGRDASTTSDVSTSGCMATVASNGYTCGSTPACSACKDTNGVSKEAECVKGVDCLAAAGPACDNNCQLGCLNQAGDSPIQACIKALQTAACGGTGC